MTRLKRLVLLATLPAGISTSAIAQEANSGPASRIEVDQAALDRDTITIGGGVGIVPSYEGSNDYVVIPAGVIRGKVSGFNFTSRGLQLSVDAVRDHGGSGVDFMFGPAVGLNFNRTGRIVDPRVRALGLRRVAVEVGGYAGIGKTGVITSAYDTLAVQVSYVRDITGIHNSYVITPSIEYGTPLSRRAYVGISGSATIVGDGYAQAYFSVDPAASLASGLPVFGQPRGGLKNYTGAVLGNYALTGDLLKGMQLFTILSYSRLQGDFARSPVTSVAGSADQFYGALGVGYTF